YPFYEKLAKAGLVNVCVHKGLYPFSTTKSFPQLVEYADVRDVGKAAKDWPQLNFVIYHSAFRFTGGEWNNGWAQFEQTGRVDWVSDLAEIPAKYGVKNVYGDLGQIFAQSTVAEPRLCAAMMGTLVKGLGADHVVWGTDAIWTGAPQWQIEALRRLEHVRRASRAPPPRLVPQRPHRLSGEPGLHVLQRLSVEDPVAFLGDVAQMRRDHRVGKVTQGMVEGQRLLVVDVEAGAGDRSLADRGDQRGLVDDRAARGVDQVGGRLHPRELTGAEKLARAVAEQA